MLQALASLGATPWMVPSRTLALGFGVALTFSNDANMTVTVQHTMDVPFAPRTVSISRSGTVATITDSGHGLAIGDNVQISVTDTTFGGSWDVATVVDSNNYTITVPNSGATTSTPTLQSFRVFPNSTLVNVSGTPPARADGNYAYPVAAVRLKCTAYTAGVATLTVLQAFGGGQ